MTVKDEPTEGSPTAQAELGSGDERPAHPGRQLHGTDARTEMQLLQVLQPCVILSLLLGMLLPQQHV